MQTSVKAHLIIIKWVNPDCFLYPDCDPYYSQNLMGSKLDQDPSSDFSHEVLTSSICVVPLTYRQTNGHENNTSLAGAKISHNNKP